jgi:hypothetical protein
VSCRKCPAAFLIEGAASFDRAVLCRVETTERGERSDKAGPVSVVRERTSPASLHGFCLGDLRDYCDEVDSLGPLANAHQREVAASVSRTGADSAGYTKCPSWRDEVDNRRASKLVDQPGRRRRVPMRSAA